MPGLGVCPEAFDVIQHPLDLRPGEIGRQRQAGLFPEAVLADVAAELDAKRAIDQGVRLAASL